MLEEAIMRFLQSDDVTDIDVTYDLDSLPWEDEDTKPCIELNTLIMDQATLRELLSK